MMHCFVSGIVLSIYTVDKTDECDIIFGINIENERNQLSVGDCWFLYVFLE